MSLTISFPMRPTPAPLNHRPATTLYFLTTTGALIYLCPRLAPFARPFPAGVASNEPTSDSPRLRRQAGEPAKMSPAESEMLVLPVASILPAEAQQRRCNRCSLDMNRDI